MRGYLVIYRKAQYAYNIICRRTASHLPWRGCAYGIFLKQVQNETNHAGDISPSRRIFEMTKRR